MTSTVGASTMSRPATRLTELVRGPMSPMHLMRCRLHENRHRIRYDWRFATERGGADGRAREQVLEEALAARERQA